MVAAEKPGPAPGSVTDNSSPHEGSAVTCHGCEDNANWLTSRDGLPGLQLHCETCHEDRHRACVRCGACLPDRHRWDRFYCSSSCRVRAHQERERWAAENPEEVARREAERRQLLDELVASFGGRSDEAKARDLRRREIKATADRCFECDRPFDAGAVIYRRARFGGPVLPYCVDHLCGQLEGHHNRDAPEGRYWPACLCLDRAQGARRWMKPEPCVACARLVANDQRTADPRQFTRDWAYPSLQVRVFCSPACRQRFTSEGRRVARLTERRDNPPRCELCRREFIPVRSDARYCSPACRQKAYRRRQNGTP